MSQADASAGTVVFVAAAPAGHDPATQSNGHERVTLEQMAARIAALLGYGYAGEHDPGTRYDTPLYYVPELTLHAAEAGRLGIRGCGDLFGGVVPFGFVATKSVSHPALDPGSFVPEGWSHALSGRLAGTVLAGYSAFTAADARRACMCMMDSDAARVKPARAVGGGGQSVVDCIEDVDATLARLDESELREYGVTIEQNLVDPVTYSVGQAEVADLQITYYGTQRLVTNHQGQRVYGGSDLHVVRGGFDEMLARPLPQGIRQVVDQARRYDAAVHAAFPGFFASRRNYDIIQGRDREGRWCSGVLEQSWRIGGASPAEIAAMETLHAQPDLRAVDASSCEMYSLGPTPHGAIVHFRGDDRHLGPITKYTTVQACGHPA